MEKTQITKDITQLVQQKKTKLEGFQTGKPISQNHFMQATNILGKSLAGLRFFLDDLNEGGDIKLVFQKLQKEMPIDGIAAAFFGLIRDKSNLVPRDDNHIHSSINMLKTLAEKWKQASAQAVSKAVATGKWEPSLLPPQKDIVAQVVYHTNPSGPVLPEEARTTNASASDAIPTSAALKLFAKLGIIKPDLLLAFETEMELLGGSPSNG